MTLQVDLFMDRHRLLDNENLVFLVAFLFLHSLYTFEMISGGLQDWACGSERVLA